MRLFNRKAQSTLEYAIIVAVVVGALIATQVYLKRGVEGRLRSSTDNIGEQYSAGNMTSKYITEEAGQNKTKEYFGTDTVGIGVTKTEVEKAPVVTRQATGADAEKVTKNLVNEGLFDQQGDLFDDTKTK